MSFFSVVASATKRAAQAVGFVADSLVNRFDFSNTSTYPGTGNTIYDLTANGNNLTIAGYPAGATFTDGHYFYFDGVNDEMTSNSVPSELQFDGTDAFSVGFWLLNKALPGDGGDVYISCQTNLGDYSGWAIYNGGTGRRNGFRIWLQQNFSNAIRIGPDVSFNVDEWYYCVVTYDGSQSPSGFSFYVNGSPVSSLSAELNNGTVSSINYSFADFKLGVRGNSLFALGGIGDVHVYNDVLTASEVLANYNATKDTYFKPIQDGLIWSIDPTNSDSYPGTGSTIYDLVGSNDGTINGAEYSTVGGPHFDFDGLNDYIDLGSIDSANPISLYGLNAYSIEVWFRGDGEGDSFQRIIDKSSSGNGTDGWSIIATAVPPGTRWTFSIDGTNHFGPQDTDVYTVGEWNQMVIVRDGSSYKNYLNTSLVHTDFFIGTPPATTTNARIGTWNHSDGREFNGGIGPIRIYDYAMSESDITENFNATKDNYGL